MPSLCLRQGSNMLGWLSKQIRSKADLRPVHPLGQAYADISEGFMPERRTDVTARTGSDKEIPYCLA